MYEILFTLLIAGAASLLLALAGVLFELLLFLIYKLDGGRMGLISYIKKL